MKTITPATPYANALFRQTLEGIQAVLGEKGLQATLAAANLSQLAQDLPANDLAQAHTLAEYVRLLEAVEGLTGRGGRQTLYHIGRAAFAWSVRHPANPLPLVPLVRKSLPQRLTAWVTLRALADGLMELWPAARIQLRREGDGLVWLDETCPVCTGRVSSRPVCSATAGYLAAAVAYGTGREVAQYRVTETACRAGGAPHCRFELIRVVPGGG